MFVIANPERERFLKYILIVLGVIAVFALLIAVFNKKIFVPGTEKQPVKNEETALSPEDEVKLQKQIAPIIKNGDMKACEQIGNAMYRSVCINNIALQKAEETKDISFCQYLDGELVPREHCEREVIFKKSMETESATACQETTNEALKKECEDSFGTRLALEKNDPSWCDRSQIPNECKDMVALGRFSTDPRNLDCASFSTEDAKNDCTSLKPLFLSATPDFAKLTETCTIVKSPIFSHVCASSGMAAPSPTQL